MRLTENMVEVNQRRKKGMETGERARIRLSAMGCKIIRNTRGLMDGVQTGLVDKGDRQ